MDFDNSLGLIRQYGFGLMLGKGSIIDMGLRYTAIDYALNGDSVDGSAAGPYFGYAI